MKVAAISTLLFATVALATPASAAQPEAAAVAPLAQPVAARAPVLEERAKKPKGGSGSSGNDTSAAITNAPARALQLGALGLGVMEVVRLWA